jgi:hypothetical protein
VGPEHLGEERLVRVDQVVPEHHDEWLLADVRLRQRHGVPEAERLLLADVVDVRELRDLLDPLQLVELRLLFQEPFQLEVAVEVVLDLALAPTGDDQHVLDPGARGLLDHELDRGDVDHGQHHLGLRLRRREEARPQPGGRDHRLPYLHGAPVTQERERYANRASAQIAGPRRHGSAWGRR